jgi:hypothetical protein
VDCQSRLRSLIRAGVAGAVLGPVFFAMFGFAFGRVKGGPTRSDVILVIVVLCGLYTATAAGLAVRSTTRSRRLRAWLWIPALFTTGPMYGAAALHACYPDSGSSGYVLGLIFGVLYAFFGGLAVLFVAHAATHVQAEPSHPSEPPIGRE